MITTPNTLVIPPLLSGVRKVARFRFALSLAALSLTGLLSGQTTDTTAETKPADPDKAVVLETMTVSGYQNSLKVSLDDKRKSDAIVDVITAQDVGKFPDTNLAESLSHIPGVTIDRLFGVGERVSILGTDPNLNRALLNGEPIATADWYILDPPSRQFNFDLLAPEVIGKAEVYRSWEARLLEGSIGGTIIVHTQDPMAQKQELSVAGSYTYDYYDRAGKGENNFSGTLIWHNPAKTIGFLIGGEDQHEYVRRDGVEALGLLGNFAQNGKVVQNTFLPATGLPQAGDAGAPPTGSGQFATDEVVNTAYFTQDRHRRGANAAFVWEPTKQFKIELTGMTVDQVMDNTNTSVYPTYFSGVTPLTNTTIGSNGVLSAFTYGPGATMEYDLFARKADVKTSDCNAKFTFTGDLMTLIGNFGYTRATGGTQMQVYGGFNANSTGNVPNASGLINPATTVTVNVGPDSASYTVNNADANWAKNGNYPGNNWGYVWGNSVQEPEVDQEKWAQLDAEIPFSNNAIKKLLVGFRSSQHDTSESTIFNIPFLERNWLPTLQAAPSNFLSGLPGVTATMANHPVVNGDLLRQAILGQTASAPGDTPPNPGSPTSFDTTQPGFQYGPHPVSWFPNSVKGQTYAAWLAANPTVSSPAGAWLNVPTVNASVGPNIQAQETINAAYLQLDFTHGALSGNVGARLVQTKTTGSYTGIGYTLQPPGTNLSTLVGGYSTGNPNTYNADGTSNDPGSEQPFHGTVNNTSTDVLPALNLAYDLGHDQIIRFAVAQVMARPNLFQEFGYTELYPLNTNGVVGGNGVGGTTGLNPYRSVNFDLDYEYYFAKNSYFSVDLFYKNITNYIINQTNAEVHANTTTWENQWFYVARPENGGKADSKGIALSYQQAFSNGLGLQVNYTYLDATTQSGGPLPYSSKNQINIGPYFENKHGLLRLTYSWRDDYATGSFNGASTVYTRPYTSLDVNATINLTHGLSLVLSARNVLNETYSQYFTNPAGTGKIFADAYKTGPVYSAGVHFNF